MKTFVAMAILMFTAASYATSDVTPYVTADWYTSRIMVDGSVLELATAKELPAFHFQATGWVQITQNSDFYTGKLAINAHNYNCNETVRVIDSATRTSQFYCVFPSDRFLSMLSIEAGRLEKYTPSISVLKNYFDGQSDKRVFILMGHNASPNETRREVLGYLEPQAKELQVNIKSVVSAMTKSN
jgi:hypothetical protein